MNKSVLAKLSVLGALVTAGCMPEPSPVYTMPVYSGPVTVIQPKPVIVVPMTPPPPPPQWHYPPHHPRLPYPPVHDFKYESCPRHLHPHRCGR